MALEIFRLVGSVFVDTDAADKSLKKTDKDAESFGTKLVNVGKKAGQFALAVGAAAVAAGTAIVGVTEATREYRTEQGKLQTAFETQNFSAEAARKTYEELNGILGDSGQAVEASNHLAMLADNEQELAQWTDICTGVFATFGDSLPIEGLTEAANETARCGQLTGPLTDAINWAAKAGETFGVTLKENTKENEAWNKAVQEATSAEDFFNLALQECSTEQERQALITKTLNGLYDEAAEKYKEVNADVIAANKAQDRLNKSMAAVGKALEPFVTKGKELVGKVLEKAVPHIEKLANETLPWLTDKMARLKSKLENAGDYIVGTFQPALDNMREMFDRVKDAVQPYIDQIADYIKSGQGSTDVTNALKDALDAVASAAEWVTEKIILFSDWCAEHPKTVETITLLIGSFAVAWGLVNTAVSIWSGVATVATAATTAFQGAIAFLTSPITIAVAIIGALIAVGVLLWQNWDVIKAKAAELWQAITEEFQQIKDAVTTKVTELKDEAITKFNELRDGVVQWVENLRSKAAEKFSSLKSSVSLAVSQAKEAVVSTFKNMYDSVSEKVTNIYTKVRDKFNEAKQTASDAFQSMQDAVAEKATAIYDKVKEKFDAVKTAISDAITGAKNKVAEIIEQIKNLFNIDLKLNIKLPHITVDGGEAPWGIGGAGRLPSFNVSWWKKAMDKAMVLTEPTIFGYQDGSFLGGGEAGNEVIVGEAHLLNLISKVMAAQTAAQNESIIGLLSAILEAIVGGNDDLLRALLSGQRGISERDFARLVRQYA